MTGLPKLSIAAKLYAIFGMLATVTAALAGVTAINAGRHAALTAEFAAASHGAQNAERISGLIYREVERSAAATAWLMTGGGSAAFLLAAFGAYLIRRAVVQPLKAITRATESVAGGEAEIVVPCRDRHDEIGGLARSIHIFRDAIRRNGELNRKAIEEAAARAQRQEQMAAEIARFGAEVEASMTDLGRITEQMTAASADLANAADQASTRTTGAVCASEEASSNVGDIASAADELSASVAEINRQVAQSNAIAEKAVTEAGRTHDEIKALDEAAKRIGDVVKLITARRSARSAPPSRPR
jgi:methyl-accepting chemotaxis protein